MAGAGLDSDTRGWTLSIVAGLGTSDTPLFGAPITDPSSRQPAASAQPSSVSIFLCA